MTISSTTRKAGPYLGNGATVAFAFSFKVFATTDVVVTKTATPAAGSTESTLVLTTDYSVNLNADQNANPGGTVTVVTAPAGDGTSANSEKITITSSVPLTQGTSLPQGTKWAASIVENALDKITIFSQQITELLGRGLTYAVSDTYTSKNLPVKASRANNFLAFDANGDPIAATGLASTAVSAAMAPVVSAATLAAGRSALGVGIANKGGILVGTGANAITEQAVGANGQILVAASGQSDGLIWTDFSKDPLNVNPNILLDQINEGALYTVSSAGTTQGPDGWSGVVSVSGGVFKMRQVADPDNAAKKCLEITCTTADAAVGATDLAYLFTDIEGYDISSLSPGTASAGSIVTMLETRSLPAGVYGIRVTNSAGNRAYVSTFTTSGAAAWQQHFLTWTLDTTGTWLYTTGTGVRVQICLMAGANYQGSTGSWGATTNFSTASQVNFLSSTSNIGYLRMHVIPGNVVCAYKPADIQRELAKAQRYYEKSYDQGQAVGNTGGSRFNGSRRIYQNFATAATGYTGLAHIDYRVTKRTLPTVTSYSPQNGTGGVIYDNSSGTDVGASLANGGDSGFNNNGTSPATTTIIDLFFHWSSSARLS